MNKLQIFSKQRWMIEDGPVSFELCLSTQRVELRFAGKLLVSSPFDLFWSVGTDLVHGWPATWHGATGLPQNLEVETTGDRLEARVEVEMTKSKGVWRLHDTWHFEQGMLLGTRSWTWQGAEGAETSPGSVLSLRWLVEGYSDKLLMPGVLYYGNPAGAASQRAGWDGVVPEWRGTVGVRERLQVEEHRLPQPWLDLKLDDYHVGLGSWPSVVTKDLYWSMGAEVVSQGTLLQLLSGPVAMNGHDGMMKTGQRNCSALLDVVLQLPPGRKEQKSYYLQVGPVSKSEAEGDGFRSLLNLALAQANLDTSGLPCFTSILHSKVEYALGRWRGSNPFPGFDMFGPSSDRREIYAMGWAGQAEAPGYAFQVLGSTLGRPELSQLAIHSLDVLAQAPFKANGFMLALNGSTGVWEEGVGRARMDLVSQGQAMGHFARAIAVGRSRGVNTSLWDAFHLKACELHAARLEDDDWAPLSAQEAFLVLPLTLGASLHREPRFLEVALKAGKHFARDVNKLWGGTLDARCEDKEGLWAGFQAFLALYEATQEASPWLDVAERTADLLLTYTFLWDVDFPKQSELQRANFKTRGWTSVSVQNMHLDVYGVLYTPELCRLGQLRGRPELCRLAKLMYLSCGQLIDEDGSQGEQIQQTNFAMRGNLSDPTRFRGGYTGGYSPFWVTAHFLTAAAKFHELNLWDQLSSCG